MNPLREVGSNQLQTLSHPNQGNRAHATPPDRSMLTRALEWADQNFSALMLVDVGIFLASFHSSVSGIHPYLQPLIVVTTIAGPVLATGIPMVHALLHREPQRRFQGLLPFAVADYNFGFTREFIEKVANLDEVRAGAAAA